MTVRLSTLGNGMTVATDPMAQVGTVALGVWVAAGARHERPEINGIAHMLEHMAFKGTARRSALQIAEEIEAVGGQINAYTSRESTAYYVRVLAGDVPLALDIIADILQHSVFDEKELTREREVILQEIGQCQDTPDDIIFDHFQEVAFPDQPMGRPVLGAAKIVAGMPRRALLDYMDEHYHATSMVLAAAGAIEHDTFAALAGEAFAGLSNGTRAAPAPARYRGGEHRETRELEQVHLLLGLEGVPYEDPNNYVLSVLSMLFGGGMSSRLFQEVRERRGLAYSIYSFSSAYTDGGLFGIYAGTGAAQLGELVAVICDEIGKLARKVSEEETARARAQLRAALLMARESTGARCEQLAQQIHIYGRPIPPEETLEKIDAVDAGAVAALAAKLSAGQPILAAVGPVAGLESYDALAARIG